MTVGDWASIITAVAVVLGGGGVLMVPRLRQHLAAQTEQVNTDREVARQRLDLDIFKESLLEAHARIQRLIDRADSAERKLAEAETRHSAERDEYEKRIYKFLIENEKLKEEVASLRAEVARLRRLTGEAS